MADTPNKLKIQRKAYVGATLKKDNTMTGGTIQSDGSITVAINPANLSYSVNVKYDEIEIPGSTHPVARFKNVQPESVSFDLIFDGTNMIYQNDEGVLEEIEAFKKLTYGYSGTHHDIGYLEISWGSFIFECRLTSLSVKYTLFDEKGNPIRATASCQFRSHTSPDEETKKQKQSSPDLTHVKVVKAGYGLRHMCYEIYGDTKLDVAVAKFNGFTTRYVSEGTEVILPPLQSI
ncbi:hypothetical protein [uncultured Microscilla sp.]|uniref:CIS tube protein n=1 Tax=uncultured Microscilla sp. TaxID=432653 RepID=UPI00262B91F5|nr:hypothetical protein [uncultured Microscilla sp.]